MYVFWLNIQIVYWNINFPLKCAYSHRMRIFRITSSANGGNTCAHGDSKEAACCCVVYAKMRHGDSRSLMLFQSSFGSWTPRGGKKDHPQLWKFTSSVRNGEFFTFTRKRVFHLKHKIRVTELYNDYYFW